MNKLSLLFQGEGAPPVPPPPSSHSYFKTTLYQGYTEGVILIYGPDIKTNGGLLFFKGRSAATPLQVYDTVQGYTQCLVASTTAAAVTTQALGSFTINGRVGVFGGVANISANSVNYVNWMFRRAPKFFDLTRLYKSAGAPATFTFSGLTDIGMVIVKRADATGDWWIWHQNLTSGNNLRFSTAAQSASNAHISVSGNQVTIAAAQVAGEYMVYAWEHDLSPEGLIRAGVYTGNGNVNGNPVNLGWEPQFIMVKRINATGNWSFIDIERGWHQGVHAVNNVSAAETITTQFAEPTPTGFNVKTTTADFNATGGLYVYLAIRRDSVVPTSGSEVFSATTRTGNNAASTKVPVSVNPDLVWLKNRTGSGPGYEGFVVGHRLTGQGFLKTGDSSLVLTTTLTALDRKAVSTTRYGSALTSDGIIVPISSDTQQYATWVGNNSGTTTASANLNVSGGNYVTLAFKRAPKFMDTFTYTGTGALQSVRHSLTVAPELLIVRGTSKGTNWFVWHKDLTDYRYSMNLELQGGAQGPYPDMAAAPSDTNVFIGSSGPLTDTGVTYIGTVFATLPGVSKVGSYIGTAAAQNIECGFSTGARFILIKSVGTGYWTVFDTARGFGYALFTSTTNGDSGYASIGSYAGGFSLTADTILNANGQKYIYLAIA